jgi:hypothetical protein
MTLAHNGNIGIGTNLPGARVHVSGSNQAIRFDYDGSDNYFGSLRWSGLQLGNNGTNRIVAGRTAAGGLLDFYVNNTNDAADYSVSPNGIHAMRINNDGRVGIGTASPQNTLHVNGGMRWGGATVAPYAYSNEDGQGLYVEHVGTTTANSRIRLQSSPSGSQLTYSQFFVDPVNGFSFLSSAGGNSGFVGIGTPSPTAKLHIVGGGYPQALIDQASGHAILDIRTTDATAFEQGIRFYRNGVHQAELYTYNGDQKLHFYLNGADRVTIDNTGTVNIAGLAASSAVYTDASKNLTTSPPGTGTIGYWTKSGSTLYNTTLGDNVGIGTSSPQKRLDAISAANDFVTVGAATLGTGQWAGIHFGYREDGNTIYRKSAIVFERTDGGGGGSNAAGKVHILNGPATGSGSATLADARLTIGETGNVGVGTTGPGAALDVYRGSSTNLYEDGVRAHRPGAFGQYAFMAYAPSSSDAYFGSVYTGVAGAYGSIHFRQYTQGMTARDAMNIISNGYVGIGTTAPNANLEVKDASTSAFRLSTNSNTADIKELGATDDFDLINNSAWGTQTQGARIRFFTNGDATTPKMLIQKDGSVGIGTTAPSQKLDVTGNIKASGHLIQGALIARPNVIWGAAGGSNGAVLIYLPGNTANYGMVHMQIDVYEYDVPGVSTYIIGGHNWNGQWYNYNCHTIGNSTKKIRLGVKNGQYVVVLGEYGSSWSYGSVALTKITDGSYYSGIMDLGGSYNITQDNNVENYTWITSDLNKPVLESQSGTTNYLARWTAPTTLGIGVAYDNGTNMGVGVTSPTARLDVRRADNSDGDAVAFGSQTYVMGRLGEDASTNKVYLANTYANSSSFIDFRLQGNAPANSKMVIKGDGNVGMGNTNPAAGLEITNSTNWSSGWRNNLRLTAPDYPAIRFFATGANKTSMIGNNGDGGLYFGINGTGDAYAGYGMAILPSGNTGIGTITPGYRLEVAGSAKFGTTDISSYYSLAENSVFLGQRAGEGGAASFNTAYSGGTNWLVQNYNGALRLLANSATAAFAFTSTGFRPSNNLTALDLGATTDKWRDLWMTGNANIGGLSYTWPTVQGSGALVNNGSGTLSWAGAGSSVTGTGTANYLARWTSATAVSTGITYDNGTNVGIGTNNPQSKLAVNTSATSPGSMLEINSRGDLAVGAWSALRFGLDANSYPNQYGKGGIIYESRDGYNRGKIHLAVNNAASTANVGLSDAILTVDGTNGTVGIGTTTPGGYKLNVQGGALQSAIESSSDAPLAVRGTDVWSGIEWRDVDGVDYSWFRGATGTWAFGGGGSSVSGKKMHIHGSTSIGSGYAGVSPPTNGLSVEGQITTGSGVKFSDNTVQTTALAAANFVGYLSNGPTIVSNNTGYASFSQSQNTDAAVFEVVTTGNFGIKFKKAGIITWNYDQDIIAVGGSYCYLIAYVDGSSVAQTLIAPTGGFWDGMHNGGSYSVSANQVLTFNWFSAGSDITGMDNGAWGPLSITWMGAK